MSQYPWWRYDVPLRDDLDPALVRVLDAWTVGAVPSPADLATLHPVPRYHLGDWRRLVVDGPRPDLPLPLPPMLSGEPGARRLRLHVSLHDDTFADSGWVLWVWIATLVRPPRAGQPPEVVGACGDDVRDEAEQVMVLTEDGLEDRLGSLPFADVDDVWSSIRDAHEYEEWLVERLAWDAAHP
jgi:hypothetical protein